MSKTTLTSDLRSRLRAWWHAFTYWLAVVMMIIIASALIVGMWYLDHVRFVR